MICIKHSDLIEDFICTYKRVGWKKSVYNIDGHIKAGVSIDKVFVSEIFMNVIVTNIFK